jgi:DNA-directed RNA polymerase specialized sigma24 family protein
MRRNGLGRAVANTVGHVAQGLGATGARWFHPRPLVPEADFQDADEPYPGHWCRLPQPWLSGLGGRPAVQAALDDLPATWREVLLRRDAAGEDDRRVAAELRLTVEQARDVLARARAALRDRLDAEAPTDGPSR